MDRADESTDPGRRGSGQPRTKRPYAPPRVLTDEAFEQISLACTNAQKMTTKKNFT